jgi:membrane-bound serine protease (ClpP class)
VLLILGGLYYELQTPGVGFPLIVSIIGALLYFGPFYIEGLARNWEILIFLLGFALIAVEVFALPGFGIAGIAGILCVLAGLILSMIDNQGFDFTIQYPSQIGQAFVTVTIAVSVLIVLVFTTGTSLDNLPFFRKIALSADLKESNADIVSKMMEDLSGKTAVVHADLKPQGKIMYEGKILNAHSFQDYLLKGQEVVILKKVNNNWLVDKIEDV